MPLALVGAVVAVVVGSIAAAALAHGGPDAPHLVVETAGALAFVSDRDGTSGIYAVNADGTGLRRLVAATLRNGIHDPPAWSPDGTMLAFVRDGVNVLRLRDGRITRFPNTAQSFEWSPDSTRLAIVDGGTVYAVRPDGSSLRAITSGSSPVWSPNGEMIAVVRDGNVYAAAVDGTRTVRVASAVGDVALVRWSPDSTRIAVRGASAFTAPEYLYVARADGTGVRALGRLCDYSDIAWSPDGATIAVVSEGHRVVIAHADGSGWREVAAGYGCSPIAWSPDATQLAYVSSTDDATHVLTVATGSSVRVATRPSETLAWAPDGKSIALTPAAWPPRDVWIAKADGSGQRRVTQGFRYGYDNNAPVWHPRGRRAKELGGTPVSPAIPTDTRVHRRTLATRDTVDWLAADGGRVAIGYGATQNCIELWQPVRRSTVRFPKQGCVDDGWSDPTWLTGLGLAGSRVAWSATIQTNHRLDYIDVATPRKPNPVGIFSSYDELQVTRVAGDRSLLVFETSPYTSRRTLWASNAGRVRRIGTYARAPAAISVDSARVAVLRADGVVEIVRSTGRVSSVLRPDVRRSVDVALDGTTVAVAGGGRLDAYDVRGGRLIARRQLRSARARLVDLARGVALVLDRRTIRLMRLRDGREVLVRPRLGPVRAQLEREGLFYSYAVRRGSHRGRVVFVPFDELSRRFR